MTSNNNSGMQAARAAHAPVVLQQPNAQPKPLPHNARPETMSREWRQKMALKPLLGGLAACVGGGEMIRPRRGEPSAGPLSPPLPLGEEWVYAIGEWK